MVELNSLKFSSEEQEKFLEDLRIKKIVQQMRLQSEVRIGFAA